MKRYLPTIALLGAWLFAQSPTPFTGKISQLQVKVDPAYEISLRKYPKWHCEATLKNGAKAEFISVKSMMQVFFHQEYFKKHELLAGEIKQLFVHDYLNGRKVEASKALYLFGSRVVGPHGDDLIPFESEANAKLFQMKNGGTKILPFAKLTKGLIRYLDM